MSLISNEIHILDGFNQTVLVFAADRRISKAGKYHNTLPKLLRIPYLRAGVSFFGVAEVRTSKGFKQTTSDWLQDFISGHADTHQMKTFAFELRESLNQAVSPGALEAQPSGFHLCGYNAAGIPEFWFITNVVWMDDMQYTSLARRFREPTEDFLGRDAKSLGWDGTDFRSVRNVVQVYRNGDIRAHVSLWLELERVLEKMRGYPDFQHPRTAGQFADAARFKMEVIAYLYRKFCRQSIIGGRIDAFALCQNLPGEAT